MKIEIDWNDNAGFTFIKTDLGMYGVFSIKFDRRSINPIVMEVKSPILDFEDFNLTVHYDLLNFWSHGSLLVKTVSKLNNLKTFECQMKYDFRGDVHALYHVIWKNIKVFYSTFQSSGNFRNRHSKLEVKTAIRGFENLNLELKSNFLESITADLRLASLGDYMAVFQNFPGDKKLNVKTNIAGFENLALEIKSKQNKIMADLNLGALGKYDAKFQGSHLKGILHISTDIPTFQNWKLKAEFDNVAKRMVVWLNLGNLGKYELKAEETYERYMEYWKILITTQIHGYQTFKGKIWKKLFDRRFLAEELISDYCTGMNNLDNMDIISVSMDLGPKGTTTFRLGKDTNCYGFLGLGQSGNYTLQTRIINSHPNEMLGIEITTPIDGYQTYKGTILMPALRLPRDIHEVLFWFLVYPILYFNGCNSSRQVPHNVISVSMDLGQEGTYSFKLGKETHCYALLGLGHRGEIKFEQVQSYGPKYKLTVIDTYKRRFEFKIRPRKNEHVYSVEISWDSFTNDDSIKVILEAGWPESNFELGGNLKYNLNGNLYYNARLVFPNKETFPLTWIANSKLETDIDWIGAEKIDHRFEYNRCGPVMRCDTCWLFFSCNCRFYMPSECSNAYTTINYLRSLYGQ